LQPRQAINLYAVTQKLQTCMTTHTHRDTGWKRLQNWIRGGEFDYDRWLVMKWVDGYVQGKWLLSSWERSGEGLNSDTTNLTNFKNNILKTITTLFPNSRSAWRVAGTLIGSKDLIEKSDYDTLINSWLVHLIVVSGGNLALVILILGLILRRIPLIPRYILIGLWLVTYVLIVWPDSSVLRALAMVIMTILWVLAGRKWSFGWMLSITTIILIRYNPMMIDDVWLRLSLGAVIGIYLTYHEVSRLTHQRSKKRYKQSIRQVLLVISASIGAWLGTLPVLIWQFGSANLTSIVANSVTGIIASITTIAELIVISLSSIAPWATKLLIKWWVRIVDQLVSLIYRIAKLTVERWVWIGAGSQYWFWIISWSIMIIFVLLYRHTQKMRVEYLLEMED
jgi:ComEC/Rec2-related protein